MLDYAMQRRIELFLLEEARLLDAGQFEDWLKLYEPQGIYWMPSQPGQTDPLNVASIMYEDHAILSMRVQRLLEARALVLTPMPRTTHLVSNIEAKEADGGEFTADAAFIPLARPFRWSLVSLRLAQWQANARAWHPLNRLRRDTR